MIDVKDLVKWYGPTLAVDRINFEIPQGQIVGFLGPNGAGKSTTLRMLTGYLPPTSGAASIAGVNVQSQPAEARAKIGYLPESTPLYQEMRVDEFLHFRGQLYGMDRTKRNQRIDAVVDRCGLSKVRRRVISHLSKGNKQRVGLAQALLHEPPVLVLDEPTAGLDPTQITHFRELLADLRHKHTVILSTHILPEVERSADRVIIITGGKIVADGTVEQLRKRVAQAANRVVLEVKAPNAQAAKDAIEKIQGVTEAIIAAVDGGADASHNDGWLRAEVVTEKGKDVREELAKLSSQKAWPLRELRYDRATLEAFFVEITATQQRAQASA